MKRHILPLLLALLLPGTALRLHAQEDRNKTITQSALYGLEYEVRAGFNIGGASPIPLPEEIRALRGYNPNINLSIEGDILKWLDKNKTWGLTLGLRLESKSMEAKARTKNYSMEIIGDGGERLRGNWTGMVRTKFQGYYFTVPLLATWQTNKRLRLSVGPYVSLRTGGDFSGNVYEGYLRETDPTGNKVQFENGSTATYDFTDDLRRFQWGLQGGVSWRAFSHLNVNAALSWGLNDIFNSDFQTITFAMYPIYLNVGFGYAF